MWIVLWLSITMVTLTYNKINFSLDHIAQAGLGSTHPVRPIDLDQGYFQSSEITFSNCMYWTGGEHPLSHRHMLLVITQTTP